MTRPSDRRPIEPTAPIAGEPEGPLRGEAAQREEFLEALETAEAATPLVQPTADEARNGWDAASLTAYLAEQQASASLRVDPRSTMNRQARRPKRQNDRYRPLRWRG
jgi:hypothetical protein